MRTYDHLESYHYDEIKKAGFEIGQKVYFQGPMPFDGILEGKIVEFDIHYEGEILFRIEYEEMTTLVPMFTVKHSKNNTIDVQIAIQKNKIETYKSNIKYCEEKIEELEKTKEVLE